MKQEDQFLIISWEGKDHPCEDYVRYDQKTKTSLVVDGVTLLGKDDLKIDNVSYPKPSPSFLMAKKWGDFVFEEVQNCVNWNNKSIIDILKNGNSIIKDFNYNIDWKNKYSWPISIVSSLSKINNNLLVGFTLTDCGVLIIRDGIIPYISPLNKPHFSKIIPLNLYEISEKRDWIYQNVLNKSPHLSTFNGDENAINYINLFSIPVEKNDIIIHFTDGFSDELRCLSFLNDLKNHNIFDLENLLNYAKEKNRDDKTLIAYLY